MLAETPEGVARVIVAHHHFAPAHDTLYDRRMQKDRRAIRVFDKLGVDLILGGHLHRAYIGNSLDFHPPQSGNRGIVIVQSGTSTSSRGRGRERNKNSFNLVEVHAQGVGITHYLFNDEISAFLPLSRHAFARFGYRLPADASLLRPEKAAPSCVPV